MSFFEEFIKSQMPEEMAKALDADIKAREDAEGLNQIRSREFDKRFDEFIRTGDPHFVQVLEICILKSSIDPQEAAYFVGNIHASLKDRGLCLQCARPIIECMSIH